MSDVVVCGAGGFIGGHLVADLLREGARVRAVDRKPTEEWFRAFGEAENRELDLSDLEACREALEGARQVYNLAADMGGMGFIEANKARCMLSVLINTHLLVAAREQSVERHFFASSACVYAADKQTSTDVEPLSEADAYPAMPEDGYGWEKLFSERMCRHFTEDFGLETRVARYHNVYGPNGTYDGGREKAPAAICRKVIQAKLSGDHQIEIWGDGEQTRSFMFVSDCVHGHENSHAKRRPGAAQRGQRPPGHDQRARLDRRRDRRAEAAPPLQAGRSSGRQGSQQRQHPDRGASWLGTRSHTRGRAREDVHLDVQRDDGTSCRQGRGLVERRGSLRPSGLWESSRQPDGAVAEVRQAPEPPLPAARREAPG